MSKKKKEFEFDVEKTFKQGVGGGILGAFVGAPGLGMGLGVLHANKDFFDNKFDKKKKY